MASANTTTGVLDGNSEASTSEQGKCMNLLVPLHKSRSFCSPNQGLMYNGCSQRALRGGGPGGRGGGGEGGSRLHSNRCGLLQLHMGSC